MGPFDRHGLDLRQDRLRLGDADIVAGDEQDRHAVVTGERRIDRRLGNRDAVEADLAQRRRAEGMRQDAARIGGAGVIADEEAALVAAGLDALHHRQRARVRADHLDLGPQPVEEEVVALSVAVGDHDLDRAGLERGLGRRRDAVGHPEAGRLPLDALGKLVLRETTPAIPSMSAEMKILIGTVRADRSLTSATRR